MRTSASTTQGSGGQGRPGFPGLKLGSLGLAAVAALVLITIWLGIYRIDAGHVGIVQVVGYTGRNFDRRRLAEHHPGQAGYGAPRRIKERSALEPRLVVWSLLLSKPRQVKRAGGMYGCFSGRCVTAHAPDRRVGVVIRVMRADAFHMPPMRTVDSGVSGGKS